MRGIPARPDAAERVCRGDADVMSGGCVVLVGLVAFTLIVNLPFGFLRARVDRYSARWFLWIHLPVPLIYALRKIFMVSRSAILLLVAAAVLGQLWGGRIKISGGE